MKQIGRLPHRAELLTIRLITGLIAIEALLEAVAVLPFHLSGESQLEPYRIVTSVLAGMGLPLIGGLIAFRGSLRSLKIINGATAVGHFMVLAGWVILVPENIRAVNAETLWILASGPAIAAAIIAWGLGWGWIVFVLTAIGFPIIGFVSSPSFTSPEAVLDSLKAFVFSLCSAAAVVALLTAAQRLDTQAEESRRTAELLAVTTGNRRARQEAHLLIHDDILSTLTFAAGNEPEVRAVVAQQARRALARIDEMTWEDSRKNEVSIQELISHIEAMASESACPVNVTVEGSPDFSIPQEVGTSLMGALAQALANSVEHADFTGGVNTSVSRTIKITTDASSLQIVMEDDGIGFDVDSVSADRLGIRNSILERMRVLHGGEATVTSQHEVGTTISLRWSAPASYSLPPSPQIVHTLEFGYGHRGILIIALVYIACHLLMAGIRLLMGATPGPSLGALLALCAAMGLLAANGSKNLSTKMALGVAGLALIATLMQVLEPVSQDAPRLLYWYLPGVAGILVLLVLNNFVSLAWMSMGAVLVISVISATSQGLFSADYALVLFRPVLMLGTGTLFLLPMNYFQRKLVQLRAEEEEKSSQTVFENTARDERYRNAVLLKNKAGSLLQILSEGNELTASQITDCLSLEGRLRDESRGHRLTQSPLSHAAEAARKRGIDVVLLDDGGANQALENELGLILTWMSHHLESMTEGKLTGRIVPEGRGELATIVIENNDGDEKLLSFDHSEIFR